MKLDIQLSLQIPKNWLPDILEALNKGKREPEIPYKIQVNPCALGFLNLFDGYDVILNTKDPVLVQRVVNVVNSFNVETEVEN